MSAKITFFPVGNGDMTLIQLNDEDKTAILIDVRITAAMDDPDKDDVDNSSELRKRLQKDSEGRPYVDAFLLSHPDLDHCTGLTKHFHLGKLEDYDDDPPEGEDLKIVIQEMWSSPIIFRRAGNLCDEAKAWRKEAKRRVQAYRDLGADSIEAGDRILIITHDEDGKTDDLEDILVEIDKVFSKVNGSQNDQIAIRVIGPLPKQDDESEEKKLQKNRSSVILQISIAADEDHPDGCLFLTGGDAGVAIWEKLWERHKERTSWLDYDLLQAPHHCSWHSLSHDSWSESDDPQVSDDARSALSQAREGAFIVSSSVPIDDESADPPCVGAKDEYLSILEDHSERFFCTGEYPDEESPEPLVFTITKEGPQSAGRKKSRPAIAAAAITGEPFGHG